MRKGADKSMNSLTLLADLARFGQSGLASEAALDQALTRLASSLYADLVMFYFTHRPDGPLSARHVGHRKGRLSHRGYLMTAGMALRSYEKTKTITSVKRDQYLIACVPMWHTSGEILGILAFAFDTIVVEEPPHESLLLVISALMARIAVQQPDLRGWS